jgi:hypothetical protein
MDYLQGKVKWIPFKEKKWLKIFIQNI